MLAASKLLPNRYTFRLAVLQLFFHKSFHRLEL